MLIGGQTVYMNDNQMTMKAAEGNEVAILTIIKLLLSKFYWLLISGIAFAAAVCLVVTFFITPKYKSRVSFYVYNSADGASHSGTINNSDLQAAENLATTYSKILGSNSVLDAVLKDLGEDCGIDRKELTKMTDVAVVADTQLLEVVITSPDANFACKVANSFAKVAPIEIVRITKVGGVEIVDNPEVAAEKSSPRTVFDTAVGFMVGAIIAAVVIIIKMLSDTTIYLPEDIDNLVGATILGQIPEISVPEGKYSYWTLVEGGVIRYENKEEQEPVNE